jgi:hypothetical protein
MKTCPTCDRIILFGGVRKDGKRYCSAECYKKDPSLREKRSMEKKGESLFRRIGNGIFMGLTVLMCLGLLFIILYNSLIEKGDWYTGPIIPKYILVGIIGIIALFTVFAVVAYLYNWLMGGGAEKYSNRQITALQRLDFQTPVRHLRFRSGVYLTRYRFKGKKVAFFDHGGCTLEVGGDKSYSYSCWGLDKVDTPVLRPGSAELATIKDYHETVIDNDEEATSTLYGFDGTTTYYKEGVTEVVAHSETPFRRKGERVIACGKRTCMAKYRKHGKVELTNYRTGRPIGHTREFLFWGHTTFDPPIPLLDGIFINLLLALDGTDCHPCQDV